MTKRLVMSTAENERQRTRTHNPLDRDRECFLGLKHRRTRDNVTTVNKGNTSDHRKRRHPCP
jgi:hypothetical protein